MAKTYRISSEKITPVVSTGKKYKEFIYSYNFNGKPIKRYIFVPSSTGKNGEYYLTKAKAQIAEEKKNGKLVSYSKKTVRDLKWTPKRKWILGLSCVLVAGVVVAATLTTLHFTAHRDDPTHVIPFEEVADRDDLLEVRDEIIAYQDEIGYFKLIHDIVGSQSEATIRNAQQMRDPFKEGRQDIIFDVDSDALYAKSITNNVDEKEEKTGYITYHDAGDSRFLNGVYECEDDDSYIKKPAELMYLAKNVEVAKKAFDKDGSSSDYADIFKGKFFIGDSKDDILTNKIFKTIDNMKEYVYDYYQQDQHSYYSTSYATKNDGKSLQVLVNAHFKGRIFNPASPNPDPDPNYTSDAQLELTIDNGILNKYKIYGVSVDNSTKDETVFFDCEYSIREVSFELDDLSDFFTA